jgi:hypothetical protein
VVFAIPFLSIEALAAGALAASPAAEVEYASGKG